jgi:carbon storage regulator
MLVLSRRPGEAIVLPTLNVTVRILSIRGNTIRLGIEGPREVLISREELLAPVVMIDSPQPQERVNHVVASGEKS